MSSITLLQAFAVIVLVAVLYLAHGIARASDEGQQ